MGVASQLSWDGHFEFGGENSSAWIFGMQTGAVGATSSLCLYNVRTGQAALARGPQVALVRGLALRDWKRPSVEELTVPRESWAKVHARNQRKFNLQLLVGLALGGYTAFTLFHNVLFTGDPSPLYKKKAKSSMRLPDNVRSTLAEMQESGAAKTYLRLNQIKDAPLSLKLVAEEEKRGKREADKFVNETI